MITIIIHIIKRYLNNTKMQKGKKALPPIFPEIPLLIRLHVLGWFFLPKHSYIQNLVFFFLTKMESYRKHFLF